MKKFLLTIMLAISTMAMQAQTNNSSTGIRLFTDGDVAFNFSNSNPLGGFMLKLKDLTDNSNVCRIDYYVYAKTCTYSDSISFNSTYSSPVTINSDVYSITMGHQYCIDFNVDNLDTLEFFRYAHNPYPSVVVKLCAVNSSGEIMGLYNVAEIPVSITMQDNNWRCRVTNYSITNGMYYHFDSYGLIPHRIQPTLDFEDLWYTEYDQVPRDPNWKQHSAFVSQIDHFIIGISFAS